MAAITDDEDELALGVPGNHPANSFHPEFREMDVAFGLSDYPRQFLERHLKPKPRRHRKRGPVRQIEVASEKTGGWGARCVCRKKNRPKTPPQADLPSSLKDRSVDGMHQASAAHRLNSLSSNLRGPLGRVSALGTRHFRPEPLLEQELQADFLIWKCGFELTNACSSAQGRASRPWRRHGK